MEAGSLAENTLGEERPEEFVRHHPVVGLPIRVRTLQRLRAGISIPTHPKRYPFVERVGEGSAHRDLICILDGPDESLVVKLRREQPALAK